MLNDEHLLSTRILGMIEAHEKDFYLQNGIQYPVINHLILDRKNIRNPLTAKEKNSKVQDIISRIKNDVIKFQDIEFEIEKEFLDSLISPARKGLRFKPGREKGSTSTKTDYINKLATDHPKTPAKELFKDADKSILDLGKPMELSTFIKKVSHARNH
jgi:hypothetical protein